MVDPRFRWRTSDDDQATLFDDDEVLERHIGLGAFEGLEFLHVNAKRVVNPVPPASRMPFRYTINAYRGCSHACVYCFARPTHEYLGLGAGEDFERKLVVKINAVERVRAELRHPRWARRAGGHGDKHESLPAMRREVPPDPGDRPGIDRSGEPFHDNGVAA